MTIDAPYNFVPLSDWIHLPDWGGQASHDLPFKDGISGEIPFTLRAHSPLLIGAEQQRQQGQPGEVRFFQTPDGRYAIPGSSLRGMLRALIEIAAFGRMRMTDERRYSVRDLTALARPFYGSRMTETKGRNIYRARPKAGWLSHHRGLWSITPCRYARVEHDDLATLTNNTWWREVPRCSAKEKYRNWQQRDRQALELQFTPGPEKKQPHAGNMELIYRKASQLGRGDTRGTLVFTGQPNKRNRNPEKGKSQGKHLEFIFYDRASEPLPVSAATFRDFLVAHASSDEWTYWQQQREIPVFYLQQGGRVQSVQSLGLALMYRLTYQHTVHQLIANTQPGHLDQPGLHHGYDLADLLFGAINSGHQASALKGRVSVGLARAPTSAKPAAPVTTILNGPKPGYYPNYIRQPAGKDGKLSGKHPAYRTFGDPKAQLRGFKRYPARPGATPQQPTRDQGANVQTTLHPLPANTRFSGRIQFHNLRPVELGALLWAITWGNRPKLRHGLGMGKPFGYGQVSFDPDALTKGQLRHNRDLQPQALDQPAIDALIKQFEDHMEASKPGSWRDSPQLRELLAMADADKAPAHGQLRHMKLAQGKDNNEFQNAKKDKQALPWYSGNNDIPVDSNKPAPIRQPFIDIPDNKLANPGPAATTNVPLASSDEHWQSARLTLDAGRGQLIASRGNESTAGLDKDQLWSQLDQAQQATLNNKKKKRTIQRIDVIVERSGKRILLKRIATANTASLDQP